MHFVVLLAEGDRLPCQVFSGVPLRRYHRPEFSVEPAPHRQGSGLRGGPALLCLHLQLHHVSQSCIIFFLLYDLTVFPALPVLSPCIHPCVVFHFLYLQSLTSL